MTNISIYNNPECSKSRAALALLEENDVSPTINYYLETPSNIGDLKPLLGKFGLQLQDIIRVSEEDFDALDFGDEILSKEIVLDLLQKHPQLYSAPS